MKAARKERVPARSPGRFLVAAVQVGKKYLGLWTDEHKWWMPNINPKDVLGGTANSHSCLQDVAMLYLPIKVINLWSPISPLLSCNTSVLHNQGTNIFFWQMQSFFVPFLSWNLVITLIFCSIISLIFILFPSFFPLPSQSFFLCLFVVRALPLLKLPLSPSINNHGNRWM